MWSHAKPLLAVVTVAILIAFGVGAAPKDEPPKSSLVLWDYKVVDLAVITAPISLFNPKSTPAELEAAEKQMKIQSDLNPEWPRNIPSESVDEFERRLVELGAEGWDLVLKDRNMVVFKRPKH